MTMPDKPNDATNPWPRVDDLGDRVEEGFDHLMQEKYPTWGADPADSTLGDGQGGTG